MDWQFALIVGAGVAGVFAWKRLGVVSEESARKHLQQGAVVVDVRSPSEFQSQHLPRALSLPLGELPEAAPRRLPDKQQVLLLHCMSGTRSGIAKRLLKGMGYARVFNLGSYHRAGRILHPRP
jgi:phage shock protein E